MKLVLIMMGLLAVAAIAQNRWDRMTGEEKQARALNWIVGAIIVIALAAIAAIMF